MKAAAGTSGIMMAAVVALMMMAASAPREPLMREEVLRFAVDTMLILSLEASPPLPHPQPPWPSWPVFPQFPGPQLLPFLMYTYLEVYLQDGDESRNARYNRQIRWLIHVPKDASLGTK